MVTMGQGMISRMLVVAVVAALAAFTPAGSALAQGAKKAEASASAEKGKVTTNFARNKGQTKKVDPAAAEEAKKKLTEAAEGRAAEDAKSKAVDKAKAEEAKKQLTEAAEGRAAEDAKSQAGDKAKAEEVTKQLTEARKKSAEAKEPKDAGKSAEAAKKVGETGGLRGGAKKAVAKPKK